MEVAHRQTQERTKEPAEGPTEEQFLKDLYLFMKKRDTPVERIPHLGFKQSNVELLIPDYKNCVICKEFYRYCVGSNKKTPAGV